MKLVWLGPKEEKSRGTVDWPFILYTINIVSQLRFEKSSLKNENYVYEYLAACT